MITESAVRELLELEAKATPGEWKVADHCPAENKYWLDFHKIVMHASKGGVKVCTTLEGFTGAHEGPGIDAQLIAFMRNLIRPLAESWLRSQAGGGERRQAAKWCAEHKCPMHYCSHDRRKSPEVEL